MRFTMTLLLCAAALSAQTAVDLGRQSKNIDFSQAISTIPWKAGPVLPGTCVPGEAFFNTAAAQGNNVYACTSTDTWTLNGGGANLGFTLGSGSPAGTCVGGSLYLDTSTTDTWVCSGTGIWTKYLTTENTGPFRVTGENGSAPAAAPSGQTALFFDQVAKVPQAIDDAGQLATMVRLNDCGIVNQVVTSISTSGDPVCGGTKLVSRHRPAVAGASGSETALWYHDGIATACDSGNGGLRCYFHWLEDGATNHAAVFSDRIPAGWTGGNVTVDLEFAGNGSGVQWAVATACQQDGSVDPPTFHSAQSLPLKSTTTGLWYFSSLSGATMAGCSAGDMIHVRITRIDSSGFVDLNAATVEYSLP